MAGTLASFSQLFAGFTGEQLKTLLETRHLYQKVSIYPTDIIRPLKEKFGPEREYHLDEIQKRSATAIHLRHRPSRPDSGVIDGYRGIIRSNDAVDPRYETGW